MDRLTPTTNETPRLAAGHGPWAEQLAALLAARRGHFRLESGHHGDLWLDLERLFLHPERVEALAVALARQIAAHRIDLVCGPLIEGPFVAMRAAAHLSLPFAYAEPIPDARSGDLYPVRYRVPRTLLAELRDRRVAVVNDVINAGSAVRGTLRDLRACGARPIVIATLAVLGEGAASLAAEQELPLESLAGFPNTVWVPTGCPLCAAGVPLYADPRDNASP